MSFKKSFFLIVLILLADQISKIYIKTHFELEDSVTVSGWFKILFVENEGMAWGARIPGAYGKLFLTIFRLVAIVAIGYWLRDLIKKHAPKIAVVAVSLIFAGAFGNIIDSVFYGVIFSDSYHQVATFLPAEGGYETLFHGKVVDMLYFPLFEGYLPEWIPFFGGRYFSFFDPVFNLADTAISVGVGLLLVFNKKAFPKEEDNTNSDDAKENLS